MLVNPSEKRNSRICLKKFYILKSSLIKSTYILMLFIFKSLKLYVMPEVDVQINLFSFVL